MMIINFETKRQNKDRNSGDGLFLFAKNEAAKYKTKMIERFMSIKSIKHLRQIIGENKLVYKARQARFKRGLMLKLLDKIKLLISSDLRTVVTIFFKQCNKGL